MKRGGCIGGIAKCTKTISLHICMHIRMCVCVHAPLHLH